METGRFNFWKRTLFLLVETDLWLITNFAHLFRAFFSWWTQCLKLRVNQFSSISSNPKGRNSFSGFWKRVFYRMLHSGEWNHCFCLVKAASTLKNLWKSGKNWCPLEQIWFVCKNGLPPNFNNSFHLQKKTRNKTIDKSDKNLVSRFPVFSS